MNLTFGDHLRSETDRFQRALDRVDGDTLVPTCPGWTADDLRWHLAEVQHFWAWVIRERPADPVAYAEPERPSSGSSLRSFLDSAHADLVAALDDAADDEAAWSWFAADQTVGFTRRRQVHEALIHRVDAELTAGLLSQIDPDLAADGVDEVLTVMFGGAPPWSDVAPGGPVGQVTCTDVDRSWLIQVRTFSGTSPNTGTTYRNEPVLGVVEHGEPAFGVAGAAADVDRWLWNRLQPGPVERFGDTSLIDSLVSEGLQ